MRRRSGQAPATQTAISCDEARRQRDEICSNPTDARAGLNVVGSSDFLSVAPVSPPRMRVAMPVAKQVHQRAGEKQQIRSRGEGVSGMRPQQIGANSCDKDCRCQSNLGAEEAVERIHGQSEQIAAFGYHRSKQRVRGRSTCVQRGVVQIRSASSPTCGARRTRRIRACLIRCVDGLLRQRLNAQRAV
jgi:hypothetical protein